MIAVPAAARSLGPFAPSGVAETPTCHVAAVPYRSLSSRRAPPLNAPQPKPCERCTKPARLSRALALDPLNALLCPAIALRLACERSFVGLRHYAFFGSVAIAAAETAKLHGGKRWITR